MNPPNNTNSSFAMNERKVSSKFSFKYFFYFLQIMLIIKLCQKVELDKSMVLIIVFYS